MTTTPARPDLAYVNTTRLDPAQLVTQLRDLLSARLVAYLGGVKGTRAVRHWADGTRQVAGGQGLRRLRLGLPLADRFPARPLREGDIDDVGPQVLAAADSSPPSAHPVPMVSLIPLAAATWPATRVVRRARQC